MYFIYLSQNIIYVLTFRYKISINRDFKKYAILDSGLFIKLIHQQ
jgi:hypothetical protein